MRSGWSCVTSGVSLPSTYREQGIVIMVFFRRFIMIFLLFVTLVGQAKEVSHEPHFYRNFWYPTYLIKRLDYCLMGGKICGEEVATRYCNMMGYARAGEQLIDKNVGFTNYLSTRVECKGWRCNGFKLITCVGAFVHKPEKEYYYRYKRFVLPRFDHYRVDWCYKNGHQCGQRVATSFCRRMGYLRAKNYKKQDVVPATKTLGDQALCFGPRCSGFSDITCYR